MSEYYEEVWDNSDWSNLEDDFGNED